MATAAAEMRAMRSGPGARPSRDRPHMTLDTPCTARANVIHCVTDHGMVVECARQAGAGPARRWTPPLHGTTVPCMGYNT